MNDRDELSKELQNIIKKAAGDTYNDIKKLADELEDNLEDAADFEEVKITNTWSEQGTYTIKYWSFNTLLYNNKYISYIIESNIAEFTID